jgi:hypothetical protein
MMKQADTLRIDNDNHESLNFPAVPIGSVWLR